MVDAPNCADCRRAMIPAKGYHAILALDPPGNPDLSKFSAVSLYVCGGCGQVRMYLAKPPSALKKGAEAVYYSYRVKGR